MDQEEEEKVENTTTTETTGSAETPKVTVNENPKKVDISNDPIAQRIALNKAQSQAQPQPQEDEYASLQKQYAERVNTHNGEIENLKKQQDKERDAEAKRQKSRQIINAIGDGVSAIANLTGTAFGAPNMHYKETLSGKSAERYDKAYKSAEERRKEYLKIVQDKGQENLKNWYTAEKDKIAHKQKQQEINIKAQAEARQLADMEFDQALAKAKAERDEKIHALDVESKTYDNDKKKIDAEFARQKNELEVENLRARKRYYDALTGKAKSDMANAKKSKSSSGGSGGSSSSSKENYILAVTDKNGVRTSEKIYPWDSRYKQLSIQLDESDDNSNSSQGASSFNWSNEGPYGDNTYVTSKQVKNGGKKIVRGFNNN